MAADDDKPARFGCLAAARWVVASAVTVAILVVVAYAVVAVLRPGDLTLKLVGSHVSVDRNTSTPDKVDLYFTLRAFNPSGRVRIYYTGIICTFSGTMNGSSAAKDFLMFLLPDDIVVDQQSSVDSLAHVDGRKNNMAQGYFEWLYTGRTISDGMLTLKGTRVVENYSGHNKTSEPGTIYYCTSITVGGDDETDADVQCTEHLPASASN